MNNIRYTLLLVLLLFVNPVSAQSFFLAENGVTIKCENCEPGDTGEIDGVTYEAANRTLLEQRIAEEADLSKLCTSLITEMDSLFYFLRDFNEPIGNWDVSNVTTMLYMFGNDLMEFAVFNQDIGKWDVRKVADMKGMFRGVADFNWDIGDWDVRNVSDMSYMFNGAASFDQDLSGWCVESIFKEPQSFATGSKLRVEYFPEWGSCPGVGFSDNQHTDNRLKVYPNPAIDQISLSFPSITDAELEILSVTGQLVHKQQLENENDRIDLSNLPEGIYFLSVRKGPWVGKEKVVKN